MAKYTAQSRILFGIMKILTFAYKRLVSIANGQIPQNKNPYFCRRIIKWLSRYLNKMVVQIINIKITELPAQHKLNFTFW